VSMALLPTGSPWSPKVWKAFFSVCSVGFDLDGRQSAGFDLDGQSAVFDLHGQLILSFSV
jgi:hypothetical protein